MASKKNPTTDDATEDEQAEAQADADASYTDTSDEEAGLVPKGDTATEAEDAEVDSVGEAVESVAIPDPGAPAPITPSSHPEAAQDRVLYENWVNSEAEAIANDARNRAVEALLAGGTVEIVVHLPDDK